MSTLMYLLALVLFIHSTAITVIIIALSRHSKSLEESRIENMRLRASINAVSSGVRNPPRIKSSPLMPQPRKAEIDFSIFDLDETL